MLWLSIAAALTALLSWAPGPARAHDLPGGFPVAGFFDATTAQPRFVLRVPLLMLTNLNLPKRGPGYLDLDRIGPEMPRAEDAVARAFRITANGRPLAPMATESRISLPSEHTFESVDSAASAIGGQALAASRNVFWNQGYFDVLMTLPPGGASASDYRLRIELPPGMAERTVVSLEVLRGDAPPRALTIAGTIDDIALDPTWDQAGARFMTDGVAAILLGTDYLLFLLCLVLPLRNDPRRLFGAVAAFTVGVSLTLIPAALGVVPRATVFLPAGGVLIAASVVYVAIENIFDAGMRWRWCIASVFGLIGGLSLASTLTDDAMQFAGEHRVTSLIFFDIGVVLAQVLFLAAVLLILALVFRTARMERIGILVISVLAAHEAWHRMTERASGLSLPVDFGSDLRVTLTQIAIVVAAAVFLWRLAHAARPGRHSLDVSSRPPR